MEKGGCGLYVALWGRVLLLSFDLFGFFVQSVEDLLRFNKG